MKTRDHGFVRGYWFRFANVVGADGFEVQGLYEPWTKLLARAYVLRLRTDQIESQSNQPLRSLDKGSCGLLILPLI